MRVASSSYAGGEWRWNTTPGFAAPGPTAIRMANTAISGPEMDFEGAARLLMQVLIQINARNPLMRFDFCVVGWR